MGQELGYRVWGMSCRAQNVRFWVWASGFIECRFQGSGFRVQGSWFGVGVPAGVTLAQEYRHLQNSGFRVWYSGFGI